MNMIKLLNEIAQHIYEKKGFNILVLDVQGISNMTDYFLIAEGNVDRHVRALCKMIIDFLAEKGIRPYLVDGENEGDWVVLDYSDFVIHLFIPELREKYALEEVWRQGKIVDVEIVVSKVLQPA